MAIAWDWRKGVDTMSGWRRGRNTANDREIIYLFQRKVFRRACVPRVAKRNRWAELFIHFVEKRTGIG